jgi:hypothetical protein
MSRHWTEAEYALALQMLARGDDDAAFRERFGKSKKSAITRRDRLKYGGEPRRWSNTPTAGSAHPTPEMLADAAKRAALPRSLTAQLCGDPVVSQSALGKKMAGAES